MKFYIKGLKLKVKKFWGLIPTFVEVTGEKFVGRWGAFCQRPPPPVILDRVDGKFSYRTVKTDSADDATILVADTQAENLEDERTDADTINILEKQEQNVSVLIGKKFSSLIGV